MDEDYRYEVKFLATIGNIQGFYGFRNNVCHRKAKAYKIAEQCLDRWHYKWVRIHDRKTGRDFYLTRRRPI